MHFTIDVYYLITKLHVYFRGIKTIMITIYFVLYTYVCKRNKKKMMFLSCTGTTENLNINYNSNYNDV